MGLVVALGVPAGWWATHRGAQPTPDRDPAGAVALASAPTSAPVAPGPVAPSPVAPASSLPAVPTVAGDPGAVTAPTVVVPVRLQVPSLDIDAPVDTVGVDEYGAMALPEQVDRVGWYEYAASPASVQGATVVAGHVDDAVQGEGAMFDLREAEVGADVRLTTADGATHSYRVVSLEEFSKDAVPLDALFAGTGVPRMVLITCGGEFDRAARSYEDNIVVTAVPV